MIITGTKGSYVIWVSENAALMQIEGDAISIDWRNRDEEDASLTLHDIAVMFLAYAKEPDAEISPFGQQSRILIAVPDGKTAEDIVSKAMQGIKSSISSLAMSSQTPLRALLQTLISCGENRSSLATATGLSVGRISTMISDPYCAASAETIAKLRHKVERDFPPLMPFVQAAEGSSRHKLGEMYHRAKGGRK